MKYFNLCILIMVIFCACHCQHIAYDPCDMNGERQLSVKKDEKLFEELITKGSVLYIDFFQFGNDKTNNYDLDVFLHTLEEYNEINIHSFEFGFKGRKKVVRVNKKINEIKERFSEEIMFFVEGNDELNIKTYFYYIEYSDNGIKIDLHKIFHATGKDVGKNIELTLKVNYSFDNGNVFTQDIKYLVYILKKDWL